MIQAVGEVDVDPISGVKYFVSSGEDFVRGLPVSQVQSAKANGSSLAVCAGAVVVGVFTLA